LTCQIGVKEATGGTVVSVAGDADLNSADELRGALDDAAARGGPVVIDLADATLLDSRTIGVLATAAKRLRDEGRAMPIACADENVLRLFSTIGLEAEFEFHPTVDAALGR
jgi:anti-sigma B factor antagonist